MRHFGQAATLIERRASRQVAKLVAKPVAEPLVDEMKRVFSLCERNGRLGIINRKRPRGGDYFGSRRRINDFFQAFHVGEMESADNCDVR